MTELLSDQYKEGASTYLQLGGESGVRKLVNRFYELMDTLSEARVVRLMHGGGKN